MWSAAWAVSSAATETEGRSSAPSVIVSRSSLASSMIDRTVSAS
jgi:hypothetical protein